MFLDNIITKIEIQKKNKNRVNVHIDDEFSFACSAEIIYNRNMKVGLMVDPGDLTEYVNEDNFLRCKNQALSVIEKSTKTKHQINLKLLQKGYDEKTIKNVMEFLEKYELVNESKYIDMYIREKGQRQGRNKIKYDLLSKGLDKEMINEKLNNLDNSSEKDVAYKLALKKYILLSKRESDKRIITKKISEYLMRSGYDYDIIRDVIRNIAGGEQE